jgi:hypothetical protein
VTFTEHAGALSVLARAPGGLRLQSTLLYAYARSHQSDGLGTASGGLERQAWGVEGQAESAGGSAGMFALVACFGIGTSAIRATGPSKLLARASTRPAAS